MSASPPPLKRPRLSLGTSHFSADAGLRERTVAASHPIAVAPAISGNGTTAMFGGVQCSRCVNIVAKVVADRADPLKARSKFDTCLLCRNRGHWSRWMVRGIIDDAQNHTTEVQVFPSLLELSARAVADLPVEQLLRNDIEIPPHVAAAEIVPRLPFHLIDRFYYEQPPQLFGVVTTETHAVAMHRFHACVMHMLSDRAAGYLPEGTDIPLWDVFDESELIFSERMNHRGVFEEGGEFLLADAPPRRVVADMEAALANFNRLSRGLVNQDVLEPDGVVVAGGSVLGALVLDPATFVRDSPFKSSDIDLFILGDAPDRSVSSVCLAQTTIVRVVSNYKRMYPKGEYAIVSQNRSGCVATCFFEGEGLPTVQVILKSDIRSPAELLATFDIDCCGVALVQGRFVASSRAAKALAHGYNIFNPTFAQREGFIPRLHKYAQRGFPVFVPVKASDLLDSACDADMLLKHLCSPYVVEDEDKGNVIAFYASTKIPEGCTTVRALVTALGGNVDVTVALSADYCKYGRKFDGHGHETPGMQCTAEDHVLCFGASMTSQSVAMIRCMPKGGLPDHPLLAPIIFPCSLHLMKLMAHLKRYSDDWRREIGSLPPLDADMILGGHGTR